MKDGRLSVFHKILVAIDGSQQATKALEVAVDLAQHYDASLCVLHAFPSVSTIIGSPEYDDLVATHTMLGDQILDEARKHIGDVVPVETQLLAGPPAPAILEVAKTEGYDVIVVGSRGHGQLAELLLGSVSHAVAQHAHCPVLIVR